jgi:hypothetical protein
VRRDAAEMQPLCNMADIRLAEKEEGIQVGNRMTR